MALKERSANQLDRQLINQLLKQVSDFEFEDALATLNYLISSLNN